MLNNFFISLIAGCGIGYFIYNKFLRSSGGNKKNSAIAAAILAGLFVIIGTVLLNIFVKK